MNSMLENAIKHLAGQCILNSTSADAALKLSQSVLNLTHALKLLNKD